MTVIKEPIKKIGACCGSCSGTGSTSIVDTAPLS